MRAVTIIVFLGFIFGATFAVCAFAQGIEDYPADVDFGETNSIIYHETMIGRVAGEPWELELPSPDIDHYFKVTNIFPFLDDQPGVEGLVCFVEVIDEPIPLTMDEQFSEELIDEFGQLFVLDLDGTFKPMNDIAIKTDCSPEFVEIDSDA